VRRLLVLNQYYHPGFEATARLLTQLCEDLALDYEVTVVAGATREARPGREFLNGVEIHRVPSTAYPRTRHSLRATNYMTYLLSAAAFGLVEHPPSLVVAQTDPPVIGLAGLLAARRFRVPLVVVVQDLLPSERMSGSVSSRMIRRTVDLYLQRADHVVAVGETMRRRLEDRGVERVTVIPNWVDTRAVHPVEKDFRDRFVVMHSGNIGYSQDLETLISAAKELPDIAVVIAGTGARRTELERAASGIPNITFRPYVPEAQLSESLSSASLHFVGLSAGLSGYAVPSRLYGVLAAGRPVIVTADEDSEAAELVRFVGCGLVLPPGRPRELAEVIRGASSGSYDLRGMGARGRQYVMTHADRSIAVTRYRQLFATVLAESASRER